MNKPTIDVVGVGPGNPALLTQLAQQKIDQATFLVGGTRHLELFLKDGQKSIAIKNNLKEVLQTIIDNSATESICVLASGDPGLYSIATYLVKKLEDIDVKIVPGISAYQYFCSQLGIPWHDVKINSAHGRELKNLYRDVAEHNRVIAFTGSNCLPQVIAQMLIDRGISNVKLTVGENLSYPDQRIVTGTAQEIAKMEFLSLSMLLIESKRETKEQLFDHYPIGIGDEHYLRAKVPMTKSEIRAVTMSKLQLTDEAVIYDVGGGSGSVSVECALLCRGSRVVTIERKPEAVELIKQNIAHFNIENIDVVSGLAPCDVSGYPAPSHVFIGGTAGNMDSIIDWLKEKSSQFRIVINAVTVETVYEAIQALKNGGFSDLDITQVAVSKGRKVGPKHLMEAHNPIYIISANLVGDTE